MTEETDDLAEISTAGGVTALGGRASMRLQAHSGQFHVVPSPPEVVVLRRRRTPDKPMRACTLSGQIGSAGALCDVLSFIGHAGWRGELVVREDASSRSIFFDQGYVVSASSDVVRERLGEVLYRHGVLTREQVTAAGDASADGSMRFGEAAVKLGMITREKLFDLMARQTEEIFYGMLLVTGGMFYFLDGFDDAELSSRHRLSPSTLVRDGIRRMHEMKYFRARIPSELHVPVRVPDRAPADGGPAYAAIDGARSVADICRIVGESEFDVTRTLFQLVQSGHVFVRPPRVDARSAVDVYNRAVSLILRELDAMDAGDAVREHLATFAANKRSYGPLLAGAGPADDGTLDADRVAANVAKAGKNAEQELVSCLHEYASYALFLARPHLRRNREPRGNAEAPRLSARVSAILEPIAPETARKPRPGG